VPQILSEMIYRKNKNANSKREEIGKRIAIGCVRKTFLGGTPRIRQKKKHSESFVQSFAEFSIVSHGRKKLNQEKLC
jgi:hypothetical protein